METANTKRTNPFSSFFKKIFAPAPPVSSREKLPFKPIDWIAMLGISLFYALFAFQNLGSTTAPITEATLEQNASIELSSTDLTPISNLRFYFMDESNLTLSIETKSNSDTDWKYITEVTIDQVFSWNELYIPPAENVRITNITQRGTINEINYLDENGNIVHTQQTNISNNAIRLGEIVIMDHLENKLEIANTSNYPNLFDEQDTCPKDLNFLCRSYFDEVYYTRTAYEFINGLITYETTHPPFGKIIIAMGTLIWGLNPFGFRFMGTLFGVLMLPFMYLIGRNITRNRGIGAFVCFLFAFDFMHFAQTRITTLDVFITFFIILMYYFMDCYINLSFYDTPLKKTFIPLGACGIFFGFGIATKWTGFYAGAGLAIIFFAHLLTRFKEYRYALNQPLETTHGIQHQHIINTFKKNCTHTIIFCLLFFIIIPFTIYLLSYIPFIPYLNKYETNLLTKMIDNQVSMFSFHSTIDATHEYASRWYEWPLMIRPILYYGNNLGGIVREGINAFGNPLVWWTGIPAFMLVLYWAIKDKKKECAFLCVAYLAQYLPWTLISRFTFIYHYFPSVPFLALMIGYCFLQLKNKAVEKKILDEKSFYCLLIIYAAAAFGLFQLFLPVLSGEAITFDYADTYLRWLDSWTLIDN